MGKNFDRKVRKFNRIHERKILWYKFMTTLSAIVVFCTTYALILPAITLDTNDYTNDNSFMTLAVGEYGSEAVMPNTRLTNSYRNSHY